MRVTLKNIADRLNVHVTTVSAALRPCSGTAAVSKELRERIIRTAGEMGYIPNMTARQMRGATSKVIGIVTPNWRHDTAGDLRRFIVEMLYARGYSTLMGIVVDDASNLDAVIRDMIGRNVDGILLPASRWVLEPKRYPIPVVSAADAHAVSENTCFMIDRANGMRLAVEHLLSHGHEKIGYIDQMDWPDKFSGYTGALEAAGIQLDPRWQLQCRFNRNFRTELDLLLKKERVRAFVCSSDFYAMRFIHYLQKHGFSVPDDVAVIGYDGTSFRECITPTLTTVVSPNHLLAKKLVTEMIRIVEAGKTFVPPAVPELLSPYLALGESCGCTVPEADLVCWNMPNLSYELQQITESDIPEEFFRFDRRMNKNCNGHD